MEQIKYSQSLKSEIETYFSSFSDSLTHACSFNYMQYANDKKITPEQAWQKFENFCKYLNRKIYGHNARRKKHSLIILPVLEGEISGKHLHFHCAIGCVDKDIDFDELKSIINAAWRKEKWTYNNAYIEPYQDEGWISYMCKESVRLDLHNIDLTRCCIPADSQMK